MIRLGLVGYPLEHSLSPSLHQAALDELNLPGSYRLFPIDPAADLEAEFSALLLDLKVGKLNGLNVTIPYKQAILNFLDELTPEASRIGAVNTIFMEGGKAVGDNTDAKGFYHDLCQHFLPAMHPATPASRGALVLGAGGAARAVVYALARDGWKVWIAARRSEQSQALRHGLVATHTDYQPPAGEKEFNQPPVNDNAASLINIIEWKKMQHFIIDLSPSLIVNATPLGMWPRVEQSPWLPGTTWPGQAFIYDLVYNPPITRWIQQARAAGLRAVNGAGMLVEQAALAFERWTERVAPRERMRQVLDARLERIAGFGKSNS